MNPVEIGEDIRRLDLMLHGGTPLRPDADFGKEEMGHLDGVKSRSPEVRISAAASDGKAKIVIERYVTSEDGTMTIEGARIA